MMHCPPQVYKDGALSAEKLREVGVAWKDVFEEIPIHVRNSPLAAAMLASVEGDAPADARDAARLTLAVAPLLEKNLEFLNDCLDDIVSEQQKARRPAHGHACMQPRCWGRAHMWMHACSLAAGGARTCACTHVAGGASRTRDACMQPRCWRLCWTDPRHACALPAAAHA